MELGIQLTRAERTPDSDGVGESLPPRYRGASWSPSMTAARHTFVLQVHADGGAVLLDEQTREYIWMKDLSELSDQIAGRVELDRPETGGEACFEEE